jgi:hypothetical protein
MDARIPGRAAFCEVVLHFLSSSSVSAFRPAGYDIKAFSSQ